MALPEFRAQPEEKGVAVDDSFSGLFNHAKNKLFEKHELPKIQGRRSDAIKVLTVISNEIPSAKDYCNDIIEIIKTLDDINDGTLKDVGQLDLRNIYEAYKELLRLVPSTYISNIQTRASKEDNAPELLLFAEQLN